MKMAHGNDIDAVPFVAADIAEQANVLCFDEFQCTDVADAMILRRLLESLMSHGVVLVTTSNRHPDELYKNGIQRSSFVPCIELLKERFEVTDLDSGTGECHDKHSRGIRTKCLHRLPTYPSIIITRLLRSSHS